MSFILVPKHGEDLAINSWTWRTTMEFIRSQNLIAEEVCDFMRLNIGTEVDADTCHRIADVVEERLASMHSGQRMLADLTVTDRQKKQWTITPHTREGEIDVNDVYSASYEWLQQFVEFYRDSGGFEIR